MESVPLNTVIRKVMGKRRAVQRVPGLPTTKRFKNYRVRSEWVVKYAILGPQAIKEAGYSVNESGIPLLRCVKCMEVKERTTDFFSANNVNGDMDKWYSRPFPSMCNHQGYPCRVCMVLLSRDRSRDVDGDGWLRKLLGTYKLPLEWGIRLYTLSDGLERFISG